MEDPTDQVRPSQVPNPDSSAAHEGEAVKDPFVAKSGGANHHRYSHFDTQLFSLGPAASPEQAKLALEAHLTETERRIQEASKLGTNLVQQRQELAKRLKEVDKLQDESEITPELRRRLEEIEKEYNEVGRETARAFLPKSRVSSSEMAAASPFVSDVKRSTSPSKFESQATNSPSKLSVPNRKQRNQPSNRTHDIEFATEISTSLLSQVRQLQTLLVEREEALRTVTLEKSSLEVEAEGFQQRLRSLNESEHRYKDENWNLETQIHEHIAAAKESADREKKLTQTLNNLQAEKAAAQKELDETKLMHARLAEDHAAAVKHHDVELGGVRRNITMAENERGVLQRKIEDLANQNQELAMAMAQHRGRMDEKDLARGLNEEDLEGVPSNVTPEHSPPPSPVKGTPRHSMLESETLKSSLHHAHRMIQNLKGNIHREKTEKLELKRMLQDARDELETRRGDTSFNNSGNSKRNKKGESKEFKKPLKPSQLGGLRGSRNEISMEDPNWEDHDGHDGFSHLTPAGVIATGIGVTAIGMAQEAGHDSSDHFETANEASDAFETANERGTETEDFHTGAEDFSGSDDLTETEGGAVKDNTFKTKRPSALPLTKAGNRNSFQSTASLSGDEYSYEDVKTPVQAQPQRLRLKMNRGAVRRSRADSEEPNLNSSPASFASSSKNGTPHAPGQTLFAELEDLDGLSEEESVNATPSRKSALSSTETPVSKPSTVQKAVGPRLPLVQPSKAAMIDASMMTDAWAPIPSAVQPVIPAIIGDGTISDHTSVGLAETAHAFESISEDSAPGNEVSNSKAAAQWHEEQLNNLLKGQPEVGDHGRPISTSTYSNKSSQYEPDMGEKLAEFPAPPMSSEQTAPVETQEDSGSLVPLTLSTIQYEHVEPVPDRESGALDTTSDKPEILPVGEISVPAILAISSISAVATEPVSSAPPSPRPISSTAPIHNPSSDYASESRDMMKEEPVTPKAGILESVFGRNKSKTPTTPIIAEDETRQSLNSSPQPETPESQKPFREISANTNERGFKKPVVQMTDESSQTALTAQQIENMLKEKNKRRDVILAEDLKGPVPTSPIRGANFSPPLKKRKSQESIGSVGRARAKMTDPDFVHDTVQLKRPNSAGSNRGSVSGPHPPLPNDHKQVIAAAAQRVSSSSGGQGTMGPPLIPASAYKTNPAFRPRTPSINTQTQNPSANSVGRGGATPRAGRTSESGDIQSPSINASRSRRSSFSSFVSEVDNRFNLRQNMPQGMDPGADPRMIQAITQTMIGEYLWKYTRKTGRGEMSENRHRRYFWVHPYTRTLYWGDRDPLQAGRAERKAKSVAIEAVRVVTDDNPMPPGLHRKSLVILTPGRAVKFTAATGQRHETWFNALSYLLLRTTVDATGDTEEVAGSALTREDVDEFNPGFGGRSLRQGPPSLSSYNSRTTRNESPARRSVRSSIQRPLAGQDSRSSRISTSTFSRLSNYWKPNKEGVMGEVGSQRARQSMRGNESIYEASEVHDSAEDLREIIEKQDRESDRLENVRACCDGKHDVGSLSHSSKKGRRSNSHSHTHTHSQRYSTPQIGQQSQHSISEAT